MFVVHRVAIGGWHADGRRRIVGRCCSIGGKCHGLVSNEPVLTIKTEKLQFLMPLPRICLDLGSLLSLSQVSRIKQEEQNPGCARFGFFLVDSSSWFCVCACRTRPQAKFLTAGVAGVAWTTAERHQYATGCDFLWLGRVRRGRGGITLGGMRLRRRGRGLHNGARGESAPTPTDYFVASANFCCGACPLLNESTIFLIAFLSNATMKSKRIPTDQNLLQWVPVMARIVAIYTWWIPVVDSLQVRTCVLEPWSPSLVTQQQQLRTTTKNETLRIGWIQEVRDEDQRRYDIRVGIEVSASDNLKAVDSESSGESQEVVQSLNLPFLQDETPLGATLWPSALAAAILTQTKTLQNMVQGKNVLELGAGLGLPGRLLASQGMAHRVDLTDNDNDIVQQTKTFDETENSTTQILSRQLDWRDSHNEKLHGDLRHVFHVILGTDLAYYFYLIRPLMDAMQQFRKQSSSLLSHKDRENDLQYVGNEQGGGSTCIIVGQANRQSQWDLYHNIVNGCYNQLTDKHEGPWEGTTHMLLYNLRIYDWQEMHVVPGASSTNSIPTAMTSTMVPIAALVHSTCNSSSLSPPLFTSLDHVATSQDEKELDMSF